MALPKSLTTVTAFSKAIALFLFILLPFAGFYLGYKYRAGTYAPTPIVQNNPTPALIIASSPSPIVNSTTNWKTYISLQGNYSFTYPSNWNLKEKKISLDSGETGYITTFSKDGNSISVNIDIPEAPCGEAGGTNENIVVDGRRARKCNIKRDDGIFTFMETQFQELSNQAISLDFMPVESYLGNAEAVETYNQILSTFKFTQ